MIDELRRLERPLTGRGLALFLGTSPDYIIAEIREGKPEPLRAYRCGRWFRIFPSDAARWLESKRVRPSGHAERVVARVLAREEARERA